MLVLCFSISYINLFTPQSHQVQIWNKFKSLFYQQHFVIKAVFNSFPLMVSCFALSTKSKVRIRQILSGLILHPGNFNQFVCTWLYIDSINLSVVLYALGNIYVNSILCFCKIQMACANHLILRQILK